MSFRSRLLIFFVIIVVVPMVAAGFVTLSLISRSNVARVNAQLTQAFTAAGAAYQEDRARAGGALERLTRDPDLRGALAVGKERRLQRALQDLADRNGSLRAIVVTDRRGREVAATGADDAVAFDYAEVTDPKGRPLGRIAVSNTTAEGFADEARQLTGLEAQVSRGDELLASTIGGPPVLGRGDVVAEGRELRGIKGILQGPRGAVALGLYTPSAELNTTIADARRAVVILLLAFLGMALASSILVVRALQGQVGNFLEAARGIGRGDFDRRVETVGHDEFAQLGQEFNAMSTQLKAKIEEVESQRRELEESIHRVGEAFAAGLDTEEIVAVAVRTAIEACSADVGRALMPGEGGAPLTSVGPATGERLRALEAAEAAALEAAREDEAIAAHPVAARAGSVEALAATLAEAGDAPGSRRPGVISIARAGEPFSDPEREVFAYLASRAAVSFENALLHRTIQEQAITDPLTGLYNRRRLEQLLANETARSIRLGHPLGLVMLDVDGFKNVNDSHGHQAGDAVLEETARLLRSQVREIDLMARYGGDEFVAILPETDIDGAVTLAERVRSCIEEMEVRAPDGSPLPVTASLGVASLPESARDGEGLLAAADLALYEAKRAGKNRVSRSEALPAPR